MAYLDHGKEALRKEQSERYDELKKSIISKDNCGDMSKFMAAYQRMYEMEQKIAQQEKQIKEYVSFFSVLSNLLPKQPSIYDTIG